MDMLDLNAPPSVSEPPPPPRVSLRYRARIMLGLLLLLILIGANLAIGSGKLHFEKVTSESMEPTLLVGDVLLCDSNAPFKRFDIIVLDDPEEAGGKLVKRLMGMPGDQILIQSGILSLKPLGESRFQEEYSPQVSSNTIAWPDQRWKVPMDQIFVMGDNRNNSYDSVNIGPLPVESVRGVVNSIVWPPGRWQRPAPLHPDPIDDSGQDTP